jgi:hypothetical protein
VAVCSGGVFVVGSGSRRRTPSNTAGTSVLPQRCMNGGRSRLLYSLRRFSMSRTHDSASMQTVSGGTSRLGRWTTRALAPTSRNVGAVGSHFSRASSTGIRGTALDPAVSAHRTTLRAAVTRASAMEDGRAVATETRWAMSKCGHQITRPSGVPQEPMYVSIGWSWKSISDACSCRTRTSTTRTAFGMTTVSRISSSGLRLSREARGHLSSAIARLALARCLPSTSAIGGVL